MVAVRNESQVILIFYDNDVQMRLSSSRTQQMMEERRLQLPLITLQRFFHFL